MQPVAVELLSRPAGSSEVLQGVDMSLLHRYAMALSALDMLGRYCSRCHTHGATSHAEILEACPAGTCLHSGCDLTDASMT